MVRFENHITAMNLTDPERKLALLLDYAGDDVHDDFLTLTVPAAGGNDPPGNDIYHRSITALNNHYAPQVQREYEIFSFRTAKQEESESLDQFVTRLRKLGATCDFANLSAEIKSQVIQRCKSSRLRTKGLSDLTMTLDDLIKTGNAMDRAVVYAQSIEGNTEMSVNQLATRKFTKQNHQRANRHDDFRKQESSHSRNQPADSKCGHCGRSYPHEGGRESCPAFKQRCHNCGTVGLYAKLCRKPQANSHGENRGRGRGPSSNRGHGRPSRERNQLHNLDVTEVANHEDDYLYTVDTGKMKNSKPMFLVQLNGVPTKMLGDSGAPVNVIDEPSLETLVPKPDIKPPDMNLYAYGSKEKALPLLGMFIGTIATEEYSHTTKVYVAQGSYGTLMSHQTAEKLNLITINQQAVLAYMKTSSNAESIAEEFADRFEGLGRLSKVQVQIHLNPDVTPVIQPHRRIPFHLRQKVKDELQHLEDMDVIERVTQPTSWVSPLVAAPKPNNADAVRLCVDMRCVNKAVLRERHVMPTVDDIISDLNGATTFSKLDLNQGYHQLELTPESRDATTFSTQDGLWRYKRLNFGVSSASEIFQHAIARALSGIDGVKNMSDDIIVYGKTKAEHNRNLINVFVRLRESNITLNRKKCEFNCTELKFYGFIFSEKGMTADPEKVASIIQLEKPTNVSEMKSLLGMTGYSSRFVKGYSDKIQPLRQLTHQDTKWVWEKQHDDAFEEIKKILATRPTLAYFDPRKKTTLTVDASPTGLGGILSQHDDRGEVHVVAYASKALSDVETRYSQTEREALPVIWACEHYHLYLYGQPVTVLTDHLPLLGMINKPGAKLSARVERWVLRLQPYDVTLKYQKGADNPADYMSRHPDK